MTARFTGSRSLDERRRRRLVSVNDDADANSESAAPSTDAQCSHKPSAGGEAQSFQPGEAAVAHFPISRLISQKLWKHVAIGLLGLLIGGGIIHAGWAASSASSRLGPGFVDLFDLS
ncbi:MAG: hypothetical protein IH899_12785, partial [Planctomycetes bacterium]|nr:hypothetical protein [Planctomycetota bacterium]